MNLEQHGLASGKGLQVNAAVAGASVASGRT